MLELFKKNVGIVSLLMLPYAILTRLYTFINPIPYIPDDKDSSLVAAFYQVMPSGILQAIVALVFIFLQALMINRIGIKHQITKDIGLLPGLLFILLVNMIPYSVACHPIIFANFFMILSLQLIFNSYNKKNLAGLSFMSGIYASVASLFYFPMAYFIVITSVALMIMRYFSFIERVQHIIGWLIPYYLLWSLQYFLDTPNADIPYYFLQKNNYFNFTYLSGLKSLLFGSFLMLSMVYFVFNYGVISSKKVITVQKKIDIFYWLALFSGVVGLFYHFVDINHTFLIMIPLGYFFALSITSFKNSIWGEIIHLIMLAILVYIHYI